MTRQRFKIWALASLIIPLAAVPCSQTMRANVVSVDTQNFNPTYNGLDFVTVQSSETLAPGIFNLGLFLNYAVNTLPYYSKPGAGEKSRLGKMRDSITSADLSFGLGLTSIWDIGISFPFMVAQTVNTKDDHGEYAESGLTEIRLATKVRLLGDRNGGVGIVATFNNNMIEDNPFVGKGGGPIFSAELVGDVMVARRLALGANVGYRWRNPGKELPDYPIEPTKDQFIASLAASLLIKSIDTKIIWEAFGSVPVSESDSKVEREQSSAETILGLKHDINSNVALHFGAGTELNHSYASPDWRVYLGTNISMGPLWGGKKQEKLVQAKAKKKKKKTPPPPRQEPKQPEPEPEPEMLEPVAVGEEYPSDADETFVLRDIHFAFDSDYRALPGAKEMMQQLADRIKGRNFEKMIIEGHTDSVGSYEYNYDLGGRRANTVRNYMVQQFGLDPNKIVIESYGETRPVGDNGNYQGRQLNRRVVFRIYYP